MSRLSIGIAVIFLGAALAWPVRLESQEKPTLEKAAEEWQYPGAKKTASHSGGGLILAVLTTKDDLAKVVKHYGKKFAMDIELKYPEGGVRGGDNEATAALNDSFKPEIRNGAYPPRAVQVAVAAHREKDYVVTVMMSQAKDEEHTHIVVSFARK